MPDVSGVLKQLARPFDDIWSLYKADCGEQLAKLRAENNLKILYTKLNASQKVKTIWNVDRPRTISSFYHPAKIVVSAKKSKIIENLDDIKGNAIVLQGVIGQGKSILLRYLLGREIRCGERVPLFVELRHAKAETLEAFIHAQFNDLLGTVEHPKIFGLFAQEGKVSLLLDGFDEIDTEKISAFVQSIEELAQKYPKAKIVVTSRPNSGLEASALFTIKRIAQLGNDDYWPFFHKVMPEDELLAKRLYYAVTSPKSTIANLIRTPLLATLLTIVYRVNQKIPSDFSDFYDELFQILLVRHDRSKPGYERKRKTKLSDRELQQVFEAYCYKLKAQHTSSVSKSKALEFASASVEALNLQADEGHFLEDIIKITCLLQEEGGQIDFLHQSIQEFFAAKYISSRPDPIASKFYTLNLDDSKRKQWDQILPFLMQLDQYRSSQHFFVPAIKNTLIGLESLESPAPAERLRELITDKVGVIQLISPGNSPHSVKYERKITEDLHCYGVNELLSFMYQMLFDTSLSSKKKRWYTCFDRSTNQQFKSYTEIAVHRGEEGALDARLSDWLMQLRDSLGFHNKRIETLDMSVEFMDL